MTEAAANPEPRRDESLVPEGTPCIRCGYELTGLRIDGRCPECGEAIERSRRGDRLEYANEEWLRTITRGVVLMRIGAAAVVLTPLLIAVLAMALESIFSGGLGPTADVLVGILFSGLWLASLLTVTVGVFLATAQEPRDREREPMESRRNIARVTMIFATAGLPATAIIYQQMFATGATPWFGYAVSILLAVTLVVGVPATMDHLAKLARRCGERAAAPAPPALEHQPANNWWARRRQKINAMRHEGLPDQLRRSGRHVAVLVALAFGGVLGDAVVDSLPLSDDFWVNLMRGALGIATLVGSIGLLVELLRIVRRASWLAGNLREILAEVRQRREEEALRRLATEELARDDGREG